MKQKTENYNLLVEDWIPVLFTNGVFSRVGIREALTQAGRIRQIAATNSMDHVSILRLLLAVLQWCKPVLNHSERKMLESAEGFPDDWLEEKLGTDDELNRAFNLLGKNGGFYQYEPPLTEIEQKANSSKASPNEGDGFRPSSDLFQELPSGTNIAHFRHTRDYQDGLCPACCTIGLVRLSAFASASAHGAKQQKPAGLNGATPVYAVGLNQSLLLLLISGWSVPVRGDAPCWEDSQEPTDKNTIGQQRGFTWQPRRIWLERPRDDQIKDTCSVCGDFALLVYRINVLPGWKRPFEKKPWPDDPHVLTVQSPGSPKKAPTTDPISFPNPSQPVSILARSWRTAYRGMIERQATTPVQTQPNAIICVGATANKALYQDAFSYVFRSPTAKAYVMEQLKWLDSIDLQSCILKALPRSTSKRPEVSTALASITGDMEAVLRGYFALFLTTSAETANNESFENIVINWRNDVLAIFRGKLEEVCSLITPGSPLHRLEVTRRARQAMDEMVTIDKKTSTPEAARTPKRDRMNGGGT